MSAVEVSAALRVPIKSGTPLFDASVLSSDERARAAASWKDRMVSEYVSARVFAGLVPQAMAAGLEYAAVSSLAAMVTEEIDHAQLCAQVLGTLGSETSATLPVDLPAVPTHTDVAPLEALVRNVISVCCCSETVAVALVGSERELAATPELAALLSRILSDEVGHARFGWRLLTDLAPRFDKSLRARLSAYLVPAFRHQLAFHAPFLELPESTDRAMAVGAPDGKASFHLFAQTIETVTIPGLERLGLDAARAWNVALAA